MHRQPAPGPARLLLNGAWGTVERADWVLYRFKRPFVFRSPEPTFEVHQGPTEGYAEGHDSETSNKRSSRHLPHSHGCRSADDTGMTAPAAAATRGIVLAVAERLFAEEGFSAVSVRQITAAAGANLASINYYFGSKDTLLLEIYKQRGNEMAQERLQLLRDIELAAGADLTLRDILRALLQPPIEWMRKGHPNFYAVKFLARARMEATPEMRSLAISRVGSLLRFVAAITRVLPHLPETEIYWRLFFTLGVEHDIGSDLARLANLSGGACDLEDVDNMLKRILDFTEAGFVAGVVGRT